MPRPKKLVVQKYLTNKEVSNLEGTWIDESFLKQTRGNSYFRTFDALLRSVFNNSVRQGIVNLDMKNVLESYENALTTVSEIGEKLDKVSWGCLDRGIYCPNCQSKLKGGG